MHEPVRGAFRTTKEGDTVRAKVLSAARSCCLSLAGGRLIDVAIAEST